MNIKKFIIGGFIGALVYFILTVTIWSSFYGDMFTSHLMDGLMKSEEELNFGVLVLAMIPWGFLLSYVINHMSVRNIQMGFIAGLVIGLLSNATVDLTFYASSFLFKGYKIIIMDLFIYTVMSGISGAAVGWYLGKNKES